MINTVIIKDEIAAFNNKNKVIFENHRKKDKLKGNEKN